MITRYAIFKFIKTFIGITFFILCIFSGLQIKIIQKNIINFISGNNIKIDFLDSSGFFPLHFSLHDLTIKTPDFNINIDKSDINLSKKLTHIRKIDINTFSINPKIENGISLSDFEIIFPIISQKFIKNINIKKISIMDQIIKNISFIFNKETGLKIINFYTKYGNFNSSFKIENSKIFTNCNFNNIKFQIIFNFLNNNLNLDLDFIKSKNKIIFDGFCDKNSINGVLNIPNFNLKFLTNFSLKNDEIETSLTSKEFKSSGRFRYNLKDNLLIADNIYLNNNIIIKPFSLDKSLKINNIDILFKENGKINIENIDFSKDNKISHGKIIANNIDISQFFDYKNGYNYKIKGNLNGNGYYKNGSEYFDFKLKNFELENIKIPLINITANYSKSGISSKIIYNFMKKQNLINLNIDANNWIINKDNKIKLDANGIFILDKFKISNNKIIGGKLIYKINANGKIKNPIFSGKINLKDAFYMNPNFGTYIKNININSDISKNNINIYKIYATDDTKNKGILKGNGKIIPTKNDFDTKIYIDINNLNILEIKNFDGRLFGKINIYGDILKELKINGNLYSNNAKFDISNTILNSNRFIDLVKKKSIINNNLIQNNDTKIKILLDINLLFKPNFNIIGYGINSFWDGGYKIYGDLYDPKYDLRLALNKGEIRVSQKGIFKLKDGEITTNSSLNHNFNIKLNAEKKLDNIDVGVKFVQNSKNSDVKFYSSPPLSERDILSYILFEKQSNEISASEGFTLFSIMNKLSGENKFDILDKMQTVFGIDTIELKKDKNDTLGDYDALSIGKKIGKMKVTIDQGAAKETTKVNLEANIAKNTKVSVDLSSRNSVGAGIFWNKRY